MKYRKLFALISICTLLTFLAPLAAKANDLDGHWAREAIEELAEEGIILPYPDGSFGPNDVVTRGDFAAMVAKTFDYGPSSRSSFADVEGHPAANYISGLVQAEVLPTGELFRPDDPITRGEAADMVIAALGLREASGHLPESPTTFQDVEPEHPYRGAIELANILGVLPPAFTNRFHPESHLTRGEAAAMLRGSGVLSVTKGTVASVNNYFSSLTVNTLEGTKLELTLQPDTTIFRNNVPSQLQHILNGDRIQLIAAAEGPRFIQVHGIVTESDVLTKVSQLTGNLLSPREIKAIMGGKWNEADEGLRLTLYDQLLELGFSPVEAELILQKDWETLQQISREAFFTALVDKLGGLPSYPGGIPLPRSDGDLLQQNLADLAQRLLQERLPY
ncbi:MAG: S-layer homology domain-containing protein [Limnochordia bacterium]|nr:S-layer homology domain-containing protein [Bacillota bacterium]